MTKTISKTDRVISVLETGETISGAQLASRFGVANPRALVSSLRMKGYPVYGNARTDSKGRTNTFYRLGTPTRAVVAAGYKALAASKSF